MRKKNQLKNKRHKARKNNKNKIARNHARQTGLLAADIEDRVDYALELLEAGEIKKGRQILDKLKKIYIGDAWVCFGLGVFEIVAHEDMERAVMWWQRATRINPNCSKTYFNIGIAYQKQVNIPKKVPAFRKVIEIGETQNQYYQQASDILKGVERMAREQEGKSIDEYIEAVNLFDRGFEAAITDFEEVIRRSPNSQQSFGNLGPLPCLSRSKTGGPDRPGSRRRTGSGI